MTTESHHDAPLRGVVAHLVRCEPCRESIAHMSSRDAAVAFLEAQRNEPGGTTVERVLKSTAHAGERVLADLLYELAKACLLTDADFARLVKPYAEPRSCDVVSAEVEQLAPTIASLNDQLAERCRAASDVVADKADFEATAMALVQILRSMEGEARATTLEGQWLNQCGRHDEAIRKLRGLVDDARLSSIVRNVGATGIARAAFRLGQSQLLEELVAKAWRERFSSPLIQMFGVASAVLDGDSGRARARLDEMGRAGLTWPLPEQSPGARLAAYVAESLGLDETDVRTLAGVPS